MNFAVLAGILLAVTLATARRVSLGGKTMQAAGEADEPEEAMREAARPVDKMMNKRMKLSAVRVEGHSTGGLVEKKKQAAECKNYGEPCSFTADCCDGGCYDKFVEDEYGCYE